MLTIEFNFSALIFCLLFCTLSLSQTSPDQVNALSSLYRATNGPNWRVKWDFTSDPCANKPWFGLQCRNGPNGPEIWSMVLKSNGLSGTIPQDIAGLRHLEFLYLSNNMLFGTIPDALGNLTELQQFGFDSNRLSGGFPDMSRLQALTIFYLQDNLLTGPLDPLASIPNIQYIWLSRNRLEGTFPDSLGALFTLQQIGVDSNRLTGSLPASIGERHGYFQAFYGQNNNFTGAVPSNVCTVPSCDLSGNRFNCPVRQPTCCGVTRCG